MPRHADLTINQGIHGVLAGTILDAGELAAGIVRDGEFPAGRAVTTVDIGKVFQRLDSGVWYGLFSIAPLNWWVIGTGSTGDMGVPTARQVIAGDGLTGGGDLTADRILHVGAHADGSIVAHADAIQVGVLATDAQHGVRGGGTQHALATTSVPGFMSAADKEKLDGIPPGGGGEPGAPLSNSAPATVGTTNTVGIGSSAARDDHVHAHGNQAGGSLHALATTSVPGFMSSSDKTKLDGIPPGGGGPSLAFSAPATVGATNSVGVGTTAARDDHVHAHGNQAGGALHAVATTSIAGFMSATDKAKLDGIPPGGGGSGLALATTAPATVGTTNTVGVGATAARDDHAHAHGNQLGGSLHALATTSVPGFMSASDKTKLDAIPPGGGGSTTTIASGAPGSGVGENGDYHLDTDTGVAYVKASGSWSTSGTNVRGVSSATPQTVGSVGNPGISISTSRADHIHAHGNHAGGTLHALATTVADGFMSWQDKVKLNGVSFFANNFSSAGGDPLIETGTLGDYYLDLTDGDLYLRSASEWSPLGNVRGLSNDTPQPLGIATPGGSVQVSRANHIHAHGNQAGGLLHAVATTSVAGFLSAADKAKLDGVASGATNTALASTTPAAVAAAGAVGVGTTAARADHVHAHGNQAGGALHALATTSAAGFMSSADKTKFDNIAALPRRVHLYGASLGGSWTKSGGYWVSADAPVSLLFELNAFLQHGATLGEVAVRVKPAVARAGGARMFATLGIYSQDMASIGPVGPGVVYDNGTTNLQYVTLSPLSGAWSAPITIDLLNLYVLVVSSGTSTSGDQVRGVFVA